MQTKYNFTKEQATELYNLYNSGLSCTKIAKQFGCATNTITALFKKYGYCINKINIDLNILISEYLAGNSLATLAKKYNTTYQLISRKLKSAGISIINRQNYVKFDECIFDNINTEEKAYWLGFIFADGYVSKQNINKKPNYKFEITVCEEDKEHLYKFNKFMKHSENNVKVKTVKYKNGFRIAYRWCVSNKHLWHVLNSYGCIPQKSLILKFPDISIFSTPNLVIDFIRGYFDGDGCISFCDKSHIRPTCAIVGTSDFLNKINSYTINNTNKLIRNHSKSVETFVYSLSGVKALSFMYMLYYKSNIYLDRKYNLFLYFKNCRFKAKALEWLEGKIGEGWNANTELIADLKYLQQCNA